MRRVLGDASCAEDITSRRKFGVFSTRHARVMRAAWCAILLLANITSLRHHQHHHFHFKSVFFNRQDKGMRVPLSSNTWYIFCYVPDTTNDVTNVKAAGILRWSAYIMFQAQFYRRIVK
jgi:hypothetical protein